MNCQQALQALYEVLDKEASEVTVSEFRQHLDECRPCLKSFEIEEAFQKFITQKAEKFSAASQSSALSDLKARVKAGLDQIDREPVSLAGGGSGKFGINRILAIAASLVLVIGAAYIGNDLYEHNRMFVPIEKTHWGVSNSLASYKNQEVTSLSLSAVYESFGYNVPSRVDGYDLLGGRFEDVMGVRMGHFVYTMGDKTVSVYVGPANEFSIPSDLFDNVKHTNNGDFYEHHCRGCRLVYHQSGDAVIVTGTTEDDVELLQFIPGTAVL